MATQTFINLPVKNLTRSMKFFTKLGFSFNPQFTDETAACMIVSGDSYVMLLTEDKFKEFTPKAICDASQCEVLVCLGRGQGLVSTFVFGNALPQSHKNSQGQNRGFRPYLPSPAPASHSFKLSATF